MMNLIFVIIVLTIVSLLIIYNVYHNGNLQKFSEKMDKRYKLIYIVYKQDLARRNCISKDRLIVLQNKETEKYLIILMENGCITYCYVEEEYEKTINKAIEDYEKLFSFDYENDARFRTIYQSIFNHMSRLQVHNKYTTPELYEISDYYIKLTSKLDLEYIDKYLQQQELNKKNRAEVSNKILKDVL